MLPYLAQGANSAIEDGAVLGHLLGKIKNKSQLPQALKLYEQLRKARGEAVVRETFKQVSCSPFDGGYYEFWLIKSPPFSDNLFICRMARSKRLGTNCSSHNSRVGSQETRFPVDGKLPTLITSLCVLYLILSMKDLPASTALVIRLRCICGS